MHRSPKHAGAARPSEEADLMALIGGGGAKPRQGKKKWFFIGGGAILLCGIAAVLLSSLSGSRQAQSEAVYREYTVERGDIVVGQNESSSVSLERETVTFSVSTSVEEVYVKEGSSVKEGDPLMKLNPDQIKIGLASYELELEQAELELQQAKLDQQTKLLEARQNYESSVQDGKLASAQEDLTVEQLKLTLANAQRSLLDTQAEYEEYVELHASYPSDYAYLKRLEERVEEYEEAVDELQNAVDEVNDLQNQIDLLEEEYELGQDVLGKETALNEAKGALIDSIQNLLASGGSLSAVDQAYLTGESITEADYATGGTAITLTKAETTYKAALSYYKTAKAAYQAASSSESGATDIAQQISELNQEIAKILDDYNCDTVNELQNKLSSNKTKLTGAQGEHSEFKEEYNGTYSNIEDEDDLAAKVEDLEAQVASAELALTKAGVSLTTGSNSAEQDSELAKNGASTAETALELTELKLQQAVDAAQEEYDTLDTEIKELKENIALDGVVLAPCTGMVASINVEEGDSFDVSYNEDLGVLMTQTLCTLTNISDVFVPITISEEDILSVAIGQEATVAMNAFEGQSFQALVDTITVESSRSGAATVSYTVNVRLNGENETLMYEGMSADVTLIQRAALDVLYINTQAVTNAGGVATVQKVGEDGKPVTTEVKTGFSDGRYVEIVSGLTEGDTVLMESAVGRS